MVKVLSIGVVNTTSVPDPVITTLATELSSFGYFQRPVSENETNTSANSKNSTKSYVTVGRKFEKHQERKLNSEGIEHTITMHCHDNEWKFVIQRKEVPSYPFPFYATATQYSNTKELRRSLRVASESAMVWNRLDTKPEQFKHAGIPLVTNNQNIFWVGEYFVTVSITFKQGSFVRFFSLPRLLSRLGWTHLVLLWRSGLWYVIPRFDVCVLG